MATITKRVALPNNAGKDAFSPVLAGLGVLVVFQPRDSAASSAPTFRFRPVAYGGAGIVQTVSPSVALSGVNGGITDIGFFRDTIAVADWAAAGIEVGDHLWIYDGTGAFKTGVYEVGAVGVSSADNLRLVNPYRRDGQFLWPFSGTISGLTWRACYTCVVDTGALPTMARRAPYVAPEENLQASAFKFSTLHVIEINDGVDTYQAEFYVRECSDENLVWFDGVSWQGFETGKQGRERIDVDFCRDKGFANRGGIGSVEITAGDLWWDPDHTEQSEVLIGQATRLGVYCTAASGGKTATFRLRSKFGDTVYRDVDVEFQVVDSRRAVGKEIL